MYYTEYAAYFESILKKPIEEQPAPYDNPDYLDYTKLNWARMNRWFKTATISEAFQNILKKIDKPQHWLVITEPWCGDAAHNVPFIEMAARCNPLIKVEYELRDSEPFSINQYLTNGTKSIPKLVIRDENGNDLAIWGPRPADCQVMYQKLIAENADFEKVKTEIQNWYNGNKGVDVQKELSAVVESVL